MNDVNSQGRFVGGLAVALTILCIFVAIAAIAISLTTHEAPTRADQSGSTPGATQPSPNTSASPPASQMPTGQQAPAAQGKTPAQVPAPATPEGDNAGQGGNAGAAPKQ